MKSKATVCLDGFSVFNFEKENCRVFFKGSMHLRSRKADTADWIKSLVDNLLSGKSGFKDFILSELAGISGLFSIVIEKDEQYFIAGDIIRCYPVFYGYNSKGLFVTDNIGLNYKQLGPLQLDNDKLEEYVASGFVYWNGTFYKNVYALQAAELVVISGNEVTSERYFSFKPAQKLYNLTNISDFVRDFDEVLYSTFQRMIEQSPNVNRWVVPLSGGHDSRIIVNYFYKLGVKNVICYSYGMPGNVQSAISRQVAEALGYRWYFVEYSEQKWKSMHDEGLFDEFLKFANNGVSTPHFQDVLAVSELRRKSILEKGDVFVPGHAFDFLVGSNLGDEDFKCTCKAEALRRTLLMHSRLKDLSSTPAKMLEVIYDNAKIDPVHFQEYFNWQEKRVKFLVNAARGYEFFGFEIRLPFWDRQLVDFWLTIPNKERAGRKLFLDAESQGILVEKLRNIEFYGKVDRAPATLIERLSRKIFSGTLKNLILRITGHKVKFNAGLNQIYALRSSTVKELLEPVEDFPENIKPFFRMYLERLPYQVDYHFMTTLYTIRKQLDVDKATDQM